MKRERDHLPALLDHRRVSNRDRERERRKLGEGRSAWRVNRSGITDYEATFNSVFSGKINDMLAERRALGQPTNVLDIMSEGQALRELTLDAGLCLGLYDVRSDDQKAFDKSHQIDLLTRDIILKKTWQDIRAWLAARPQPVAGFDLVLCRQVGSMSATMKRPDLLYYLLQQAWSVTTKADGMLLLQGPSIANFYINLVSETLAQTPGIESAHGHYFFEAIGDYVPVIKIIRHANAPDELPKTDLSEIDFNKLIFD